MSRCPWTAGGNDGHPLVQCEREAAYWCRDAPDSCEVHRSSCCQPKRCGHIVDNYTDEICGRSLPCKVHR